MFLHADANRNATGIQGDSTISGGGTDDTAAIQAFLSAASAGDTVVLGAGKSGRFYRITDTLSAGTGVSLLCYGTIVYEGTDQEPAVSMGVAGTANPRIRARLDVVRVTNSNWSSESNIGVRLINTSESDVDIVRAQGFTIGAQLRSHLGLDHSHIRLRKILDAKFGLDVHSFAAGGTLVGNKVYGGNFSNTAGVNDGTSRYGVRFASESGAAEPADNDFYGPAFALDAASAAAGVAHPFLIANGATRTRVFGYRSIGNTSFHLVTGSGDAPVTFA